MNKHILVAAGLALAVTPALAQKSAIRTANNHLSYKEYDQAKKAIEGAIADPSTKDDPKAWYTRGNIYFEMAAADQYKAERLYREAGKSYMRAAELGSKEEELTNRLYAVALYYYNDARQAYNDKAYGDAYEAFGGVGQISSFEGGKRFSTIRQMDTVAAEAKLLRAYSAYGAKDYSNAATSFEEAKNNAITKDANNYLILADIYRQQGNDTRMLQSINEGRSAFPDNQNLRNEELNYYIRTGKQGDLVVKLEQAVAAEPTNSELYFNLGNGYMNMAFPKAGSGGAAPARPADYDSLVAKAERSFASAIKLSQNNADYNYNLGALYFNEAAEYNKQMNAISGTSAADMRKVDAIKVQRNALFSKATPYLERSAGLIEIKGEGVTASERDIYQQSLFALKEVYLRTNEAAKAADVDKKYKASLNK